MTLTAHSRPRMPRRVFAVEPGHCHLFRCLHPFGCSLQRLVGSGDTQLDQKPSSNFCAVRLGGAARKIFTDSIYRCDVYLCLFGRRNTSEASIFAKLQTVRAKSWSCPDLVKFPPDCPSTKIKSELDQSVSLVRYIEFRSASRALGMCSTCETLCLISFQCQS